MVRLAFGLASLSQAMSADDHWYTAFHPQPLHNWMNDPNGPMYFNGRYHLFFQYNPDSYNWGNMHWYHVVSTDLVHWEHLPVALAPDQDYDCGGVFSGSVTIVRNTTTGVDVPIISYAVNCGKVIVNAVPADVSDPNLVEWVKPSYNPVIPVPSTVNKGFRDPTTAWQGTDGVWRMLVGCDASACEFKSTDFVDWTYVGKLHQFDGSGFWECPDFYKLPGSDSWLFKASAHHGDWWTVGDYEEESDPTKPDRFVPRSAGDILENDQKYDSGNFYASKTFYDPKADRQVLFGWVNYHCSGADWSGVQTFPRAVTVDPLNSTRILNYPISEIETLRLRTDKVDKVTVAAGSTYSVPYGGAQLDVEISVLLASSSASFSVGALVAPTNGDLMAQDSAKVAVSGDGQISVAVQNGAATLDGHPFASEDGEPLALRLLVDRSIVEAFAQGGRSVSTHHDCRASADATGLQITNNGAEDIVVDITVHQLDTANVMPSQSKFFV